MTSINDINKEIQKLRKDVDTIKKSLKSVRFDLKTNEYTLIYNFNSATTDGIITSFIKDEMLEAIVVKIETVFNGTAPTLRLYDNSENLLETWETNIKETFLYEKRINKLYSQSNKLSIDVTQSGSTAGSGYILVKTIKPKNITIKTIQNQLSDL